MLDVNKPKLRCRKEAGFQFQGGRGASLGGVKLPATHANWRRSSEKHAATLRQDQPTTKWHTRKLKHGDLNATQHTSAQQLGQKTKDDTSARAYRHGCYERGCCNLPLKAHQQCSANHGGSKKTLQTVLPTHTQGKIVTNQCQVMTQQRLVLAPFRNNSTAFSHPVNKPASLRLKLWLLDRAAALITIKKKKKKRPLSITHICTKIHKHASNVSHLWEHRVHAEIRPSTNL